MRVSRKLSKSTILKEVICACDVLSSSKVHSDLKALSFKNLVYLVSSYSQSPFLCIPLIL